MVKKMKIWLAASCLFSLLLFQILSSFLIDASHKRTLASERELVTKESALVREQIEDRFANSSYLISGLVATFSARPDMGLKEFNYLAADMVERYPFIRSIVAAPDFTVKFVYPLEGNEQVIGINYHQLPSRRDAAFQVRKTGRPVIVGPTTLMQGVRAFIVRFPVYKLPESSDQAEREFWGIISIPLDSQRLYEAFGLLSDTLPITVAIQGSDGKGYDGDIFFGPRDVFDKTPVETLVNLPGGAQWVLAAAPNSGWATSTPDAWLIRALSALIALSVFLAVWFALNFLAKVEENRQTATEASNAKTRFIANMSHELKTPLNGIHGFITLLENSDLDAQQVEYIALAADATRDMTKLVTQILDIAMLDTKKYTINRGHVLLPNILASLMKRSEDRAKETNLTFSAHIQPILHEQSINIDQKSVLQIINALLDNALRFTNDGSIQFNAELSAADQNELHITVRDSGSGIAPKDRSKIFGHFVQVDDTLSRMHGGAGLGLSLARGLAEYMGGSLNLECPNSGGSVFSLIVPIIQEETPEDTML